MTKPWHGPDAPADPVERESLYRAAGESIGLLEADKLMADLAALCEELTKLGMLLQHAPDHTCSPELYRTTLMGTIKNPDGTPRWPRKGE